MKISIAPVKKADESDEDFFERYEDYLDPFRTASYTLEKHSSLDFLKNLDENLKEFRLEVEVGEDDGEYVYQIVKREG
jgi:hypothetical protein